MQRSICKPFSKRGTKANMISWAFMQPDIIMDWWVGLFSHLFIHSSLSSWLNSLYTPPPLLSPPSLISFPVFSQSIIYFPLPSHGIMSMMFPCWTLKSNCCTLPEIYFHLKSIFVPSPFGSVIYHSQTHKSYFSCRGRTFPSRIILRGSFSPSVSPAVSLSLQSVKWWRDGIRSHTYRSSYSLHTESITVH